MGKKYFGTDGIRGRAGELPMVPEFFVKLGWAIGSVLDHHTTSRVLIGKDTRITGYMFESALQSGLTAAGVDVYMLGPMPTPGIAYLTQDSGFDAGIVISRVFINSANLSIERGNNWNHTGICFIVFLKKLYRTDISL